MALSKLKWVYAIQSWRAVAQDLAQALQCQLMGGSPTGRKQQQEGWAMSLEPFLTWAAVFAHSWVKRSSTAGQNLSKPTHAYGWKDAVERLGEVFAHP